LIFFGTNIPESESLFVDFASRREKKREKEGEGGKRGEKQAIKKSDAGFRHTARVGFF